MKKNITYLLLAVLFIGAMYGSAIRTLAHEDEEDEGVSGLVVNATKADLSAFTVDGGEADWDAANVPKYLVTLRMLNNNASTLQGEFKIAYNDTHLALLFIIEDDYQVNLTSPRLSPAVAVEWKIDDAAGPHMGVDGGQSLGKVDIWHWKLQHNATYLHTPNPNSGRSGNGLDDEWATSPTNRYDDAKESSLYGAWNYNSEEGEYVFEFMRPFTTNDANDTQFSMDKAFYMNLAYWDPSQSETGWSGSGHYITVPDYNWIQINIGTVAPEPQESSSDSSPAFLLWATLVTVATVAVLKKKKY